MERDDGAYIFEICNNAPLFKLVAKSNSLLLEDKRSETSIERDSKSALVLSYTSEHAFGDTECQVMFIINSLVFKYMLQTGESTEFVVNLVNWPLSTRTLLLSVVITHVLNK